MTVPIDDYAILGDGRSAALVDRGGSVDWLCWPRFDSPSVFGAILDTERGGSWRIAPASPFETERRYLPHTPILETRFHTDSGTLRLTDFMSATPEEARRAELLPDHELVRIAECEAGEVELEVTFAPRPRYGARRPRLRSRNPFGISFEDGGAVFALRSDLDLKVDGGDAYGRTRLRAGEGARFLLTFEDGLPCVLPPLEQAHCSLERTRRWWTEWVGRCEWDGPYRDLVTRSLITLKLLTYAPSGGIVAAVTTSLPERPGGPLNWDYRFCWLRDVSWTVEVLVELGYEEEAHAFVSWLLHTTRLTRPSLRVLYDVFGRKPRSETELEHLAGHGGARPVRIGNGAADQTQLDIYGEVVGAVALLARRNGYPLDRSNRRMLAGLGSYVCEHWDDPDNGIWEERGARKYHTHSWLMCWATLNCLIELHEAGMLDVDAERFRGVRDRIRKRIETRGWDPDLGAYTRVPGEPTLDTALLAMGWYGFHPPDHPRLQATAERLVERLGAGNDLLYRFDLSFDKHEGAFIISSFWMANYLAQGGGSLEEAERCFEAVVRRANDLGLLSEEMDPNDGSLLGNFPQAFSHVGLIAAALSIRDRARKERSREEAA